MVTDRDQTAGPARFSWRHGLAGRVTALVALVLVAALASTLVLLHQVREVQRRFELLTDVYVAFDHALASAHLQAMRIGQQVAAYQDADVPPAWTSSQRRTFQVALAERARAVRAAREPIAGALGSKAVAGDDRALRDLAEIDRMLADLEAMVAPTGQSPEQVLADVRGQAQIERAFQNLAERSRHAIAALRGDVEAARRRTEHIAVGLGGVMAALAVFAVVGVMVTLRPLRRLTEHVRELSRGHWPEGGDAWATRGRDDEVKTLAREFHTMAEALAERERRLIEGERLAAMGRMAAQITHEIRNPLSSLALHVELLEDELPAEADEGRRLLGKVTAEVDRLSAVTEEYLGFARRPKPDLRRVDLVGVVADLLEFFGGELGMAGVDVEFVRPSTAMWVEADRDQIRQAVLNLLRNAQEAVLATDVGERSPRIHVRLHRPDPRHVAVDVEDNGPGVDADPERIFEAFFTTKARGTGLGLPIVRQIARDHGGNAVLARTGPDGSVFRLLLPSCDPPSAPVPSGAP
ncbi:MAG: sensor histidine kinase [Deltaproteobacteria bacterium]|nr:MAG: sensor histidine kinase [Deltaproteobacteria bacterium]